MSILQMKNYASQRRKVLPGDIYSERRSWELDSGQFHGLFSLPRYLEVQVKGKKFSHNTILTP